MRSTPSHLPLVWGLGEGSRFASTTSEAGVMPNGPRFPEELCGRWWAQPQPCHIHTSLGHPSGWDHHRSLGAARPNANKELEILPSAQSKPPWHNLRPFPLVLSLAP